MNPKQIVIEIVTLIRDAARATHAGEGAEVAARAESLISRLEKLSPELDEELDEDASSGK